MEYPIFRRKIYSKLLKWKKESGGKTALLIEGARRIGKSTIVEEFAKKEYTRYLIIDFAYVSDNIKSLFNDLTDLQYFFVSLQALTGKALIPGESVIIFDEVQFCPKARQAIKLLVKDGRFHYIETGSLISIKKNIKDILIPSEERCISMFPMDFEEFLWAIGKDATYQLIQYSYEKVKPLGEKVNRDLMKLFRLYMLVGGMPQSVAEYLEKGEFSEVDKIKRDIITLYINDFKRIDSTGKASEIFKSIPGQLSRDLSRFRIGEVIPNSRYSRLTEIFTELDESFTVDFCYLCQDPNVGMSLNADRDIFKMYICDTGLFVTMCFWDKDFTDNHLYQKLLTDKLAANLGYVYENVVAQLLRSSGHALYYNIFRMKMGNEGKEINYEIDFLISHGEKICPIEVKSSGYKAHKSLVLFKEKYSSRIEESYVLTTKDVHKEGSTIYLPVYMASLL
ncbi:MAG: ATP-binding protein [Muribaculaceae bacterium]|nr:ATP-binding protein [Muribaculaceae bacterium]